MARGGKVKDGEKIIDAAVRETKEEIGVDVKNLQHAGLFHFKFPHKPEWDQDVTLFISGEWLGEPAETEEMVPKWFAFSEIPYDKMWADDKMWMPFILQGKKLEADFVFKEGDAIEKYNLKEI